MHRNTSKEESLPLSSLDEKIKVLLQDLNPPWAGMWGNVYAEIERNEQGEAIALHPISPSRVIDDTPHLQQFDGDEVAQ